MHTNVRIVLLGFWLLAAALSQPGSADDGTIWIEGESCTQHTMRRHSWYDSVVKTNLSGGDWLSHFSEGATPEATFTFDVTEGGSYHFWIRCNPVAQARLEYQLDRGQWQSLDFSQAIDQINIAADGKPDLRFIAWVNAGTVSLDQGRHSVAFRFQSQNNHHGAIDCFVFSRNPFQPRGLLKPGERSGLANAGFFAWEPDVDAFQDTALVDLRYLNEDAAGQKGRVRAVGNGFVLGDGTPVKFWAANAGPSIWRWIRNRMSTLPADWPRPGSTWYGCTVRSTASATRASISSGWISCTTWCTP